MAETKRKLTREQYYESINMPLLKGQKSLVKRIYTHPRTDDFVVDLFPYKIKNRESFYFRDHPENLSPISLKYKKYWDGDFLRHCLEGKWVEDTDAQTGEKRWVFMYPKMFFYINYAKILDKKRNRINPRLRDNEFISFTYLICSEGFSGFDEDDEYTCNNLVYKLQVGEELKSFEKRRLEADKSVLKPDGTYKVYIDPWEYLTAFYLNIDTRNKPLGKPLYENGYNNIMWLACRAVAKSLTIMMGHFYHEFLFSGVKRYEDRNQCNNALLFGIASPDSEALSKTLAAFEKAYNDQPGRYEFPLIKKTKLDKPKICWGAYYKNLTGTIPQTSGSFYHDVRARSQQKIIAGSQVQKSVILTTAEKAFTGERYRYQIIEEAGFLKHIKTIYTSAKDAIAIGEDIVGQFIALGTGGVMGAIKESKEMFLDPTTYRIFAIPNYWEKGDKYCGLFSGLYYKDENFKDEQGNTMFNEVLEYIVTQRAEDRKKKTVEEMGMDNMWNPLYPKEILRSSKKSPLPKVDAMDHLHDILSVSSNGESTFSLHASAGRFVDTAFGVDFKADLSLEPLYEWGDEHKKESTEGAWLLYEAPPENIPDGLYYILYDPIAQTGEGTSIQAIYVYKHYHPSEPKTKQGTIVASYVGRQTKIEDNFHEVLKAANYFNAKIFSENNAQAYAEFILRKSLQHMQYPTPYSVLAMYNLTSKTPKKDPYGFGYKANERINMWNLNKFAEWLTEPTKETDRGEVLERRLHTIKDPRILSEIVNFEYEEKSSFDAMSAMMSLPLLLADLEDFEVQDFDQEEEDPYFKYDYVEKPRPRAIITLY